MPLTFLQKAHKESLLYASWLAKTLADMEAANLDVFDPFLAYLAGIAASIHIEHSLSSNTAIASSAKEKIQTCMAYLTRVARVWPKVEKRIIALEELQARVGNRSALDYVEDEYDGAVPVRSVRHVSMSPVDERNMWLLFDSSNDTIPGLLTSVERAIGINTVDIDHGHSVDPSEDAITSALQLHGDAAGPPLDFQRVSNENPGFSEMDSAADWSLLGMPWLAYFPTDADLLGVHNC